MTANFFAELFNNPDKFTTGQEISLEDLKDYLTGQFADGWGESFEQRAIEVSGREIYVHYWDSHEYYIKTEEEMEQDFEQEKGMQGMGGMSGM